MNQSLAKVRTNDFLFNIYFFKILVCGTKYFKFDVGPQPCVKCGNNSAGDFERKICHCKYGYKRLKRKLKDYTSDCFSKYNLFFFSLNFENYPKVKYFTRFRIFQF